MKILVLSSPNSYFTQNMNFNMAGTLWVGLGREYLGVLQPVSQERAYTAGVTTPLFTPGPWVVVYDCTGWNKQRIPCTPSLNLGISIEPFLSLPIYSTHTKYSPSTHNTQHTTHNTQHTTHNTPHNYQRSQSIVVIKIYVCRKRRERGKEIAEKHIRETSTEFTTRLFKTNIP